MLRLDRLEKVIIAILALSLLAGLGIIAYKKSLLQPVTLRSFDPAKYKSSKTNISAPRKININTASAGELAALKGIGQKLASRIVEYRAEHGYFISLTDIKKVKGIGDAIFESIKDRIALE